MTLTGNIFLLISRFIFPVLAIMTVYFASRQMFSGIKKKKCLAILNSIDGKQIKIFNSETLIGSNKKSDILTQSEGQAVLQHKNGIWSISGDFTINGSDEYEQADIDYGDVIGIGSLKARLSPPTAERETKKDKQKIRSILPSLIYLSLFQIFVLISILIYYSSEFNTFIKIAACFAAFISGQWIYFLTQRKTANGIEIMAFLLTTMSLCVAASANPQSVIKLTATAIMGIASFYILSILLRDTELCMKLKYPAASGVVLLFIINFMLGKTINGASNWIQIAGYSIQPSEFIKPLFIFASASTLYKLNNKNDTILFFALSAICLGALFWMRDFGTAAVYFMVIITIVYMRTGSITAVTTLLAGATAGIIALIQFMPYIANRFFAYRHVWQYSGKEGYQQTRTMIGIASGGFAGLGTGNGNLKRVAASDTDLVFGIISEEWGLIIALLLVSIFIIFAIYTFKSAVTAKSTFYIITASAACIIFIFQQSLNMLGSVDILPLTGVTMPFVSNGGSSMIASWSLLAFIKAISIREIK